MKNPAPPSGTDGITELPVFTSTVLSRINRLPDPYEELPAILDFIREYCGADKVVFFCDESCPLIKKCEFSGHAESPIQKFSENYQLLKTAIGSSGEAFKSVHSFPVFIEGRQTGLVTLLSEKADFFGAHMQQTLHAVNELITVLHDRHYAVRRMQEMTETQLKMQQDVQRAEKFSALGKLSSAMCHELTNPLQFIKFTADIVQYLEDRDKPKDRDELLENFRKISAACTKAADFLHSIQSCVITPKNIGFHSLSLNSAVQEGIEILADNYRQSSISINTDFDPDAPFVIGGAPQIQSILINLAGNAAKTMKNWDKEKAITIRTISGTNTGSGTGHALEVTDTGPGTAADLFNTASDANTFIGITEDSINLSLYIVESTANAMGAVISAHRSETGGSVFRVEFRPGNRCCQ